MSLIAVALCASVGAQSISPARGGGAGGGGGGSGNHPPTISIAASSTTVTAGSSTNITATTSDSDGTVTLVTFYRSGTPVCIDFTAPFTCALTMPSAGNAQVYAIATDNAGLS
ncbi:MAG TPA: Ig-like domain-containing protein, partial [Casimicrobiaceae bacterium]|nr:Ig-like domain-containing protein [Casimicrobiaceae bacterium]